MKHYRRKRDLADSTVNIKVKTTGAKQAESSFKKLGNQMKNMSVAAIAVGVAAKGMFEIMSRGGLVKGVENAFRRMGGVLGELREATRGTVSDFKLMQAAVQAQNLGVKDLATLFKFASIRARETGENVDYLVNSIVTGIGRKSVLILDNLGLSATRIQEEFKKTGDFAGGVAKIINEEMAGMDEDIGAMADETSRMSVAWDNAADSLSVYLATLATVNKGEVQSIYQALIPSVMLENFTKIMNRLATDATEPVLGMVEKTHGGFRILIDDFEEFDKVNKETSDSMKETAQVAYEFAEAIAKLNISGMDKPQEEITRMTIEIERRFETIKKQFPNLFQEIKHSTVGIVAQWDTIANTMSQTFDYVFTETLVRQQNFGEAFQAGLESMIQKTLATMAANSLVFGLMSLFTAGGFAPIGGALNFITSGMFSHDGGGMSPNHNVSNNSGGGNTTNINMPNVAMINSRSIGQINQALSRHRRLH